MFLQSCNKLVEDLLLHKLHLNTLIQKTPSYAKRTIQTNILQLDRLD